MRIVIFVQEEPHPLASGSALRNRQNILACSHLAPVLVVCMAPGRRRTVRFNNRITIKYYGSAHAWLLSDALVSRCWTTLRRAYNWLSRPIGERLLCRAVRHDVSSFRPTLAIFEEYKCAALVPSLRGLPVEIVYDAHNVETVLQGSLGASPTRGLKTSSRVRRATVRRERQLVDVADQVWVCSELEGGYAAECFGSDLDIRIIPNTIDPSRYDDAYESNLRCRTEGTANLVFCGNYLYPPNQQAAEHLIRDIFPKIADDSPDARLTLLGRAPTASMGKAARHDPRIKITGFVTEPAEMLGGGQISLIPLLVGGGTRLKVLEAFASGCAVISTRKGCEGLAVTEGKHVLFAETPEEFVAMTKLLLRDPGLRKRMIRESHDLVAAQYSFAAARRRIEQAIRDLAPDRRSIRAD
jgi:glycosyltransferase involved in cell wall biosynthesis